jgi:hypothetical protein
VLSPKDSPLGKLMSQYVCLRIVRMDNVDIGLFEHDRNNTLYFYMLNGDEQIYMRYGGRDSQSQDTYLSLDSLELALKQGLELHKQYQAGKLPKTERPKPAFPKEIPLLVKRTFAQGQCVECHLIGDFQNLHREQDGTLDKLVHLYRSPDIKMIGIHLDVPKGLVVKEAKAAVEAAGMRAGDRIAAINGTAVWTFADLQEAYGKVDRKAKQIVLTVDRAGQSVDLKVDLPPRWWYTDVRYRQSSVEPRLYFDDRPILEAEKVKLGLKPEGFASEVKYVADFAKIMKTHELKVGDIIYSVDGVETDELANTAELYMKIRVNPDQSLKLGVIRDGQRMEVPLRTYRLSFRK